MIDEEKIQNYMKKLSDLDAKEGELQQHFFMQSKIEAHLEMICLLGMTDMLMKMERKKK